MSVVPVEKWERAQACSISEYSSIRRFNPAVIMGGCGCEGESDGVLQRATEG